MRRGLLLYNPAAGRLSVRLFVRDLVRSLSRSGWQVEVAETLNGSHATHAARQAAAEGYDTVFAIGGDGTASQVTTGLMGTETALAVLPAGTTNVWAREQGMHPFAWYRWWALRENAGLLADSAVQRVDVGLCNGFPFLLWGGIGLDALVIHRLEPRPRLAKYLALPQFAATIMWESAFWNGMDLRVSADGREVEGHFLLAVATNIRRYAGGMAVLSPEAMLDDGEMDLWLFSGKHLADALRQVLDLLAGRHVNSDQARRLPFSSARVESDEPFSVQVDGEPALGGVQAELSVQARALKVLMPQRALELLKYPSIS
jgi:YegS/Rv2252/BmrU family lipid kinase